MNQKEKRGNLRSSPLIQILFSIGNGYYQIKVEGKRYTLPFQFTMKPEVRNDGRFHYLVQNDVCYKLKRDDSGSLCVQNKERGTLTKLNESSEDLMHGREGNSSDRHISDTFLVETATAELTSDGDEEQKGKVDEASDQTVKPDRNPTDVELEEFKPCAGTSSTVLSGGTVVGASSVNMTSGQEANHTYKGHDGASELGQSEKLKEEGHLDLKRNAVCKMQDKNKFIENKDDTSEGQKYGQGLAQYSVKEDSKNLPNQTNNADMDMLEKSEDQTPQSGEGDKQIISKLDSNQAVETQRATSPKGRIKSRSVGENQTSDSRSLEEESYKTDAGHSGNKEEDIRGTLKEMNGKDSPKASTETLDILLMYRKTSGAQFLKKMMTLSCTEDFLRYWNFYTQTSEGKEMLEVIVSKHQCSVAVSNEVEDLFIFEVFDQCFKHESDIEEFVNMVINSVYQNAQHSLYLDCFRVEVVIQDDFLQKVKQRKELDAFWIAKAGEHNSGVIYAVSREENKESMFGKITEIIDIAWKCFENHEEKVTADNIWKRVLEKFGYLEEMNGKFLKTKIIHNDKLNAFLLKGVRNETKAAAEHLEKLLKTAHVEVHGEELSIGCQFEIFTNPEMCDYIDSMIQNIPTPFVWIPNHHTQKLHIFSRNPEYINSIYKSIEGCVQEKGCPLSRDMLSLDELKSIEELKKKHKGKVLIQPSDKAFLVTAACDIFESVYAAIQDICSQKNVTAEAGSNKMKPDHKTDYDSIRSKGLLSKKGNEISKCIEVHDRQFFKKLVKEDLSKFEHLANKHDVTICKIEKTNRLGFELRGSEADVMYIFNSLNEKIKSKKQAMQLQHDNNIPAENVEAQMEASSPNATRGTMGSCMMVTFIFPHTHSIVFFNGEVEKCTADVIVTPVLIPFSSTGPQKLPFISTESTKLKMYVPLYIESNPKAKHSFSQNICATLRYTGDKQCGKVGIAIRPLGGWDLTKYTKIFLYAISDFFCKCQGITGRKVYLCISDMDVFVRMKGVAIDYLSAFITGHNKTGDFYTVDFDASSFKEPSMQPSNPVLHFEKVEVRVETGELSQTKADVIVNTTSENLDLKVGTISKSILKAAGQTIQDECKKAYPDGIRPGKVAITSGGRMKCKNIFHGALKPHSSKDWDKILKKFVDACLTRVSNMKFKSIAFPALGTGILKLPRDQVAHIMTSCVKEFSSGQSNTLEKVTFVIYHRDEMTLKVFQDTILKFKAAEKEKTESSDFEIHVTGLKDKVKEVITSIETELKKVPEEDTDVPGSCPSATNLSEVDQDDSIVYIECKIEVAEDILNSIKITYGQQGIDSLISDLDKLAKVDTQKDRILVFCDYKDAENVQKCVRNHYNKVNEERKLKEENKHLIHGENENLKEWLQFAYGHTSWSKNLQLEGGKLYLTGTLQMKREVEKAVHSMNYWYKEEFTLNSEEQQKADEVVAVIKSELPTIFIKQTKDIMIVLSDNRDNFERACFKVKVALGRIKITARGRRHRDPLS